MNKIKAVIDYCQSNLRGVLIAIAIVGVIGLVVFNYPLFVVGLVVGALAGFNKDRIFLWLYDKVDADDEDEDEEEE